MNMVDCASKIAQAGVVSDGVESVYSSTRVPLAEQRVFRNERRMSGPEAGLGEKL